MALLANGYISERDDAYRRRQFSALADQDDAEFGAAVGRAAQPVTSSQPTDDAYRRGTPAYYARLREMLNAPIQAIAPGYGSLSPEGQPALPTWVQERLDEQERAEAARKAAAKRAADLAAARGPEPKRVFDLLRDQDDAELGAAQGRVSAPVTARQERRQPAPKRLFDLLRDQDDAELGAAQGRVSAPVTARQERRQPAPKRLFDLLADQDDAELGAARGRVTAPVTPTREPGRSPSIGDLTEEQKRALRNPEHEPPSAQQFDELAGSHRGGRVLVPEIVIQVYEAALSRGDFTDKELAFLEQFPDEVLERAAAITEAELLGTLSGDLQARRLRSGTEITFDQAALTGLGFVSTQVDRATGGPLLRGALLNPPSVDDPLRPLKGAIEGFRDPSTVPAARIGPIRHIPDWTVVPGTEIGLRDVAALGTDMVLGLDALLPSGPLFQAGESTIRGARRLNGAFDESTIARFDPQAASRAASPYADSVGIAPGSRLLPREIHPDVPGIPAGRFDQISVPSPTEVRTQTFVTQVLPAAAGVLLGRAVDVAAEIAAKWNMVSSFRNVIEEGLLPDGSGGALRNALDLAESAAKAAVVAYEATGAWRVFRSEDLPRIMSAWEARAVGLADGSIHSVEEAIESMRPVLEEAVDRRLRDADVPAALRSRASDVSDLLVFVEAAAEANGRLNVAISLAELATEESLAGPQ